MPVRLPIPPVIQRFKRIEDVDRGLDVILRYLDSTRKQVEGFLNMPKLPRFATADLPDPADPQWDTTIVIEDGGAGNQNLVFYSNGLRYRVDGGTGF